MPSAANACKPKSWQVFALRREIYLQGIPTFRTEPWLRKRVKDELASPMRRYRDVDWTKFRTETLAAAEKHRNRQLSGKKAPKLYLENLVPLMTGVVEEYLANNRDGADDEDPKVLQREILGGYHYVDTELSGRPLEFFHLESVIGVTRSHSASAMRIDKSTASSHLISAWTQMKGAGVNVSLMRQVVEATGGYCPSDEDDPAWKKRTGRGGTV